MYGNAFRVVVAFIVSLFIFFTMYFYLNNLQVKKGENTEIRTSSEVEILTSESHLSSMRECTEKAGSSYSQCYESLNKDEDRIQKSDEAEASPRPLPIKVIFTLLWLVLFIQIFITLFSLKHSINQKYYYISDWCVSSAPMLGVLGTIFSFSLLASEANSKGVDLKEMFNKYFFDAAITTIIGGAIYVINLALAIVIVPRIKIEE